MSYLICKKFPDLKWEVSDYSLIAKSFHVKVHVREFKIKTPLSRLRALKYIGGSCEKDKTDGANELFLNNKWKISDGTNKISIPIIDAFCSDHPMTLELGFTLILKNNFDLPKWAYDKLEETHRYKPQTGAK